MNEEELRQATYKEQKRKESEYIVWSIIEWAKECMRKEKVHQ